MNNILYDVVIAERTESVVAETSLENISPTSFLI